MDEFGGPGVLHVTDREPPEPGKCGFGRAG